MVFHKHEKLIMTFDFNFRLVQINFNVPERKIMVENNTKFILFVLNATNILIFKYGLLSGFQISLLSIKLVLFIVQYQQKLFKMYHLYNIAKTLIPRQCSMILIR